MTTFEIILTVVLAIFLIHYIWWTSRTAKAVTQHKDVIEKLHPAGGPAGSWPPDGLKFP